MQTDVASPPPAPPRERAGTPPPAPVWLAVAATLLGLLLAWGVKASCVTHPWSDNYQYKRLCYNDLQPLFGVRGIERGAVPYKDQVLEYPVLTGVFMYGAGVVLRGIDGWSPATQSGPLVLGAGILAGAAGIGLSLLRQRWAKVLSAVSFTAAVVLGSVFAGAIRHNDNSDYFVVSAIMLAPFALAVTLALRPMVTPARLMLWAVGSPLVIYAFHNWDLPAVAAAAWAFAELERGRHGWAGTYLGLGASAKLYPGFLLPGFVLDRLAAKDLPGARRVLAGFVVVAAAVNLPFLLLNAGNWFRIWSFHARRYPDFGTVWYWLARHGRRLVLSPGWDPMAGDAAGWYLRLVSVASLLLFAAGSLWFLRHGWRRAAREGAYPTAAVGLGIVALFLLVSKVHSPQYSLWVIPLVALLDVPWRYVVFYLAADVAVFVSGFYYFTVMTIPAPGWQGIFELAVLSRAAALGFLVWYATRAVRLYPRGYEPVRGRNSTSLEMAAA
jgi:uncharacterized membrane protein